MAGGIGSESGTLILPCELEKNLIDHVTHAAVSRASNVAKTLEIVNRDVISLYNYYMHCFLVIST